MRTKKRSSYATVTRDSVKVEAPRSVAVSMSAGEARLRQGFEASSSCIYIIVIASWKQDETSVFQICRNPSRELIALQLKVTFGFRLPSAQSLPTQSINMRKARTAFRYSLHNSRRIRIQDGTIQQILKQSNWYCVFQMFSLFICYIVS